MGFGFMVVTIKLALPVEKDSFFWFLKNVFVQCAVQSLHCLHPSAEQICFTGSKADFALHME